MGEPERAAPVLFAEKRAAGGRRVAFATLNAEKALNALSIGMIRHLYGQLQRWEADPEICCIVLQGAGERAFCPGGNLRDIYGSLREYPGPEFNNPVMAAFFAEEYRLDYSIHTCSKPLLCWGHGIVMGAGIGLMNGASHRVVTEGSRLAMPEITIGLYPDVGGSWFLNRMPGRCGLYLSLTCAPMNAADALFLDIGDYFIPSDKKEEVYAALPGLPWIDDSDDNRAVLSSYLRGVQADLKDYSIGSLVRTNFDFIQSVTEGDSLLDFASALREADGGNTWIAGSQKAFFHGSPTSAHVIFEMNRRARRLSLKEVFQLEYDVSLQFADHPDLAEGIRALIIDKDHNPAWTPATLEAVDRAWVEEHFAASCPVKDHPLRDL